MVLVRLSMRPLYQTVYLQMFNLKLLNVSESEIRNRNSKIQFSVIVIKFSNLHCRRIRNK